MLRQVDPTAVATNAELLISADSHVDEPPDLWATRLPADLRDALPPLPDRSGDLPGATDPADRLGVMERDGVSMEVLYPTLGLTQYKLTDAHLQRECFRVYNDWIVEYCAGTPGRLVGVPMISAYDIDLAVKELERTTAAGLKGALLWHVPPDGLEYTTGHYDRLWAAAEEMAAPINLHILSGFSYSSRQRMRGIEQFRGSVEYKVMDAIHGLFDFLFYGTLDRFPRLKLVLVEFEIGWIPWILQQWDYYARRHGEMNGLELSASPSELFERQVYATFVSDEVGSHHFPHGWGVRNCMWSNDFPHGNSSWPNSRQVIDRDLGGLAPEVLRRILSENVTELYGLEAPPPIGG
ncbi:MAG TPA: amidohydrolase family protein [Acidimicrobiales bacterium]|nr:amidohydrolase family protein [Acidimicrobiales bacterium]